MLSDNRILLNGVLSPKLLNNPVASCFFHKYGLFTTAYSTLNNM